MERWLNRVAVVTGASSGVGAAACQDLVEKGMIVVGLARRYERLQQLQASLPAEQQNRFHPIKCDISNEADILKTFALIEEQVGGVDVLVNNAGTVRQTKIISEGNTDDLRAVLETNLLGVALCTREAFRSMRKRDVNDGHVLIVNSIAGHHVPNIPEVSFNMYAPSKFGLTALNEVLRQEFFKEGTNIKITNISPGAVRTDMIGQIATALGSSMPMLRAEDVADAISYCIQTPPHVQIHELTIKPVGEIY